MPIIILYIVAMLSASISTSANAQSPNQVFGIFEMSVIECFETDGGVNYRSDRLILF
jgi:hypothetical protein